MGVHWGGQEGNGAWQRRLAFFAIVMISIFLIASGPWVVSGGVP